MSKWSRNQTEMESEIWAKMGWNWVVKRMEIVRKMMNRFRR